MLHQTEKALTILSYKDMTDESVKPFLSTFARYESSHESPRFSINDSRDVTVSLISVSAAIQDSKYRVNLNKPVMWLRRYMKTHNVDYVKDWYLEGTYFTQDETTDVSLKQCLWFLKLQGETQKRIQKSSALYRKVLREGPSNLSALRFHNQHMRLQIPRSLVMDLQFNFNTHGHTIQHQCYKK